MFEATLQLSFCAWSGHNVLVPGPAPRLLLRHVAPAAYAEALRVVDRSDVELDNLGASSNLSVTWRCITCGQQWDATPASRSRGGGCPACAWKRRGRSRAQAPHGSSVAELYPRVAAEFIRNLDRADMGTADLRVKSQQMCVWRCADCSHQWEATVANRTSGRGCTACANQSRATSRRTPTRTTGTAAQFATFPLVEFVANLTNPGLGLTDLRPSSVDRCQWRCSTCSHEWEASVTNRISKNSGCSKCGVTRSADSRSSAPRAQSLLSQHRGIAAEFVENMSRPKRGPDAMWPKSSALCRWRCQRGHEWVTTVAARVAGSGCASCGARGQSRLEFEVAELLQIATTATVKLDVPVRANGRTWRLDLEIPQASLLVDLDPHRWHTDAARDQRKVDALSAFTYVRIRPTTLPLLTGLTRTVPNNNFNAYTWALALRDLAEDAGLVWRTPSLDEQAEALTRAVARWHGTLQGKPARSVLDVAPHLADELIDNLTRPSTALAWLTPNAKDICRWRCQHCGHEWSSSIGSRAGRKSGCPACARERTSAAARVRSLAMPGGALVDKHSNIAAEFVTCLTQPQRTPSDLLPSSNLRCRWQCSDCGHQYDASPATRTRGRGCAPCARRRAGELRSVVHASKSLATQRPDLAADLMFVLNRNRSADSLALRSNLRARWKCVTCTHEWVTTISSRVAGTGCPACGRLRTAAARAKPGTEGSVATQLPTLAAEFLENLSHPGREPGEMALGSHDRCRWRCADCGHEWDTAMKNRARNSTGCPRCQRGSR